MMGFVSASRFALLALVALCLSASTCDTIIDAPPPQRERISGDYVVTSGAQRLKLQLFETGVNDGVGTMWGFFIVTTGPDDVASYYVRGIRGAGSDTTTPMDLQFYDEIPNSESTVVGEFRGTVSVDALSLSGRVSGAGLGSERQVTFVYDEL